MCADTTPPEGCEVLNIHRLRWALLCVAATTGSLSASAAGASHTVKIGNGDSIDSLARQYHISVRAIAKANGITPETILRNGRKIIIPDAPKPIVKQATMRRPAMVTGNRIAIRIGPDSQHRRLVLVDHGTNLVVTRQAGEWLQVETERGRIGWIRSDFVRMGKGTLPAHTALAKTNKPKKVTAHANRLARIGGDEEASPRRSRRSRRAAALAKEERSGRRHKKHGSYASSRRGRSRHYAYHRSRGHNRPEADAPPAEADVIRMAYGYRGTPYRYGASGKSGFDCSGFTSYVYKKQGVSLPHNASAQFSHGQRVKGGKMKPGDLVFFHTTRRGISHVGIYAGEGKFVHASSGGGRVRVDTLESGYYKSRLVGARRIK